tara:strand:- start:6 stop:332 length:327 start_codon:yes stop_codon:yes gene_type:complete
MVTDFSSPLELFAGGILLSSFFFAIHLVSTINPYHKALAPMIFISVSGIIAACIVTLEVEVSPLMAVRGPMSAAIVGISSLLPLIAAIVTLSLLRITLLTNRSVGPSS